MKTPEEIAEHHLDLWFRDGVSVPGDNKPTLIKERVVDAITEALDTIDDKYLASELARVEKDRDSWMEAYLKRGAELKVAQKERDEAVRDMEDYRAMLRDPAP